MSIGWSAPDVATVDGSGTVWGDGGDNLAGRHFELLFDGSVHPSWDDIPATTTSIPSFSPGNCSSHAFQIRAVNGCGVAKDFLPASATAQPDTPGAPSLTDLDPCSQSGVEITWSPVTGATAYDLRVDASTVISGVTSPYVRNPGNTASHTYQVRARNSACTGAWSASTSFADGNATPATPGTPTVTDPDACAQSGVLVAWSPVAGATAYDLRVDGSTVVTGVTSPHLFDPGNTSSHTYQVRATAQTCAGAWSATRSFADGNAGVATPAPPGVTDLDACAQNGVQITWGPVAGATAYDLRLDGSSVISNVTSPYVRNPGNTATHTYEVRARNTTCTGAWSTATSFADGNATPATPTTPTVTDPDACAQSGVQVAWSPVTGATGYDLRVDSSTVVTGVTSPHLFDPGNTSSHTYQVRADRAVLHRRLVGDPELRGRQRHPRRPRRPHRHRP